MFGWGRVKSPITLPQEQWIETKCAWLLEQFGSRPLLSDVVTPTDQFFPDPYAGSEEDATALLRRVCRYMQIDAGRIDVSFYTHVSADIVAMAFNPLVNQEYPLGTYHEANSRIHIRLETNTIKDPMLAVATVAHELGHIHLLGDGRYSPENEDHEQLTDLITIFFGLGIFLANAAIREESWRFGNFEGWSASKRGYLSHPELAYALAVYAQLRGDTSPAWAKYLRPDVRVLFQSDLKRIQHNKREWLQGQHVEAPSPETDENDRDSEVEPANEGNHADRLLDEEAEFSAQTMDRADQCFTHACVLNSEGDFEGAIAAFTAALELKPRDAEIWLHRADAYVGAAEYQQAIADCNQGLRLDPSEPKFYLTRATAKVWLKNYYSALEDLEFRLGHHKQDPMVYLLRAIANCGVGELKQAKSDIEYAIRKAPQWPNHYLVRSQIFRKLGKQQHADADLFEAISREPSLNDAELRKKWLGGAPI